MDFELPSLSRREFLSKSTIGAGRARCTSILKAKRQVPLVMTSVWASLAAANSMKCYSTLWLTYQAFGMWLPVI